MTNMHRLGDIRTTKIDNHGFRVGGLSAPMLGILSNAFKLVGQRIITNDNIQKAGTGDIDPRNQFVSGQIFGQTRSKFAGIFTRLLGCAHAPITLKVGKFRTIGFFYSAPFRIKTPPDKNSRTSLRKLRSQIFHLNVSFGTNFPHQAGIVDLLD
ncbi:MAG: Uncharacterised protein [Hyphomonas sp. TMED17]|nr:MAG: Uncharacterised protein [Hyphomonas sp. TMED17]